MLNLDSTSSIAEIKSAYRKAASLYHPDAQSGQADVEKFHGVVQAYNMILEERKNGKSGQRQGWISRLLHRSREHIMRLIKSEAPGKQWARSFAQQGYWSTLNVLVRKIDLAETEEERIKAARSIFRLYRSSFLGAAIPRLATAEGALLLELIKMLAFTGDKKALEAITPYLHCDDRETMLTTYVALECSGPAGHAVLGKTLGLETSFLTRLLDSLSSGSSASGFYKAPVAQVRRMRKFAHQCGAPMSLIMSRMGYSLGRTA